MKSCNVRFPSYNINFPSYEEILKDYKEIKTDKSGNYDEKSYWLDSFIIGGCFKVKLNEDGKKTIALDYIGESGYLQSLTGMAQEKYKISKLYKLNKTNYNGLRKLYEKILVKLHFEVSKALWRDNNG